MPLIDLDRLPVREIFPGLRARLIHSDRVTHSWVSVDEGATFPEHQHPHEQIVSVLEGELELVVGGVKHRLLPGQVFAYRMIFSNSSTSGISERSIAESILATFTRSVYMLAKSDFSRERKSCFKRSRSVSEMPAT